MTERFKQCVSSIVFKYLNDERSNCLDEAFEVAPEINIQTRGSLQELKYAFRKTNPLIQPCGANTLKRTKNLITFKHNLKEHYLILSLPVSRSARHNTDLPSNSNISKTVRVNVF